MITDIGASGPVPPMRGGNGWAISRGRTVLMGRTHPGTSRLGRQHAGALLLAGIMHRWRHTLTDSQRAAWGEWTSPIAWPNRRRGTVTQPGVNGYAAVNMLRAAAQLSPRDDAPDADGLAEVHQPAYSQSGNEIHVLVVSTDPWYSQDDACAVVNIESPRMLTQAARGVQGAHLGYLHGSSSGGPVNPNTWLCIWPLTGANQPWVSIRVVDGHGRPSVLIS